MCVLLDPRQLRWIKQNAQKAGGWHHGTTPAHPRSSLPRKDRSKNTPELIAASALPASASSRFDCYFCRSDVEQEVPRISQGSQRCTHSRRESCPIFYPVSTACGAVTYYIRPSVQIYAHQVCRRVTTMPDELQSLSSPTVVPIESVVGVAPPFYLLLFVRSPKYI